MVSYRTISQLNKNNYRRWLSNPRYYVIFSLIGVWIHFLVTPVVSFSQEVGVRVTPWIFPFLQSRWYPGMVIALGVVLLYCDAPFMNSCTPYEYIRSGRNKWVLGQLTYVVSSSIVYGMSLFFISLICLLPQIELSLEWGKVLNTLAQTSAATDRHFPIDISYEIIQIFSPMQATLLSLFLTIMTSLFMGLIMFLFNLLFNRFGGVLAGFLLAFGPAFVGAIQLPFLYYCIPTTWLSLVNLDLRGKSGFPSLEYVVIYYTLMVLLLSTVIFHVLKKREIKILLPV